MACGNLLMTCVPGEFFAMSTSLAWPQSCVSLEWSQLQPTSAQQRPVGAETREIQETLAGIELAPAGTLLN